MNDLFDKQVRPCLEKKLQQTVYPLFDVETTRVDSWLDLLHETEESLSNRSSSRRSVRRRARYFASRVYDTSPEFLYDELGRWWASIPPPESLSKITSDRNLAPNTDESENQAFSGSTLSETRASAPQYTTKRRHGVGSSSYAYDTDILHYSQSRRSRQTNDHSQAPISEAHGQIDEVVEPLLKRPRLEPQVLGNPTLFGEGPYLSFSFMRRHMVDKLPEQFRKGIEKSKLWREEQDTGGLSITNCLSLYLPRKVNEDALLIIRMEYSEGFTISDQLGIGDPEAPDNCI